MDNFNASSPSRVRALRGARPAILAVGLIPLMGLALTVASCAAPAPKKDKPLVAVSILPQEWFVKRIAGDLAATVTLVGAGQDPHSWEPSPRQMETFNRADAWILSGTDFELALVPKVRGQNPALRIVDGTEGVAFRTLEAHGRDGEADGSHEGDSDHAEARESPEVDRHTWLGREPAKILASHVSETLAEIDPAHAETFRANLAATVAEIDAAFDALDRELAPLRGTKVFVYHPSFGYFLDEFGIAQEAVETGGKEPTARHLAELIAEARADKPAAVFVQAQFPGAAARAIADAVGARVVPLDPLAADWLSNVVGMGERLKEAAR